jgi:hypothetical protein
VISYKLAAAASLVCVISSGELHANGSAHLARAPPSLCCPLLPVQSLPESSTPPLVYCSEQAQLLAITAAAGMLVLGRTEDRPGWEMALGMKLPAGAASGAAGLQVSWRAGSKPHSSPLRGLSSVVCVCCTWRGPAGTRGPAPAPRSALCNSLTLTLTLTRRMTTCSARTLSQAAASAAGGRLSPQLPCGGQAWRAAVSGGPAG